ncbi:MAG: fluoride efflux transporter CrcB [Deltaproteobacteria bacterium]|nr:fluoride efflux transporter CrcB [Deltaproteobacteria bacterium]
MLNLLAIGCGGFCGAISRFLVSEFVYSRFSTAMPYGTLTVNLVGSFVLGIVAQVGLSGNLLSDTAKSFIGIGFLGAFTTFSTFSVQTLELFEAGSPGKACANILLNVALCLLGAWSGFTIGRVLS